MTNTTTNAKAASQIIVAKVNFTTLSMTTQ
jgi:hypothetical protein